MKFVYIGSNGNERLFDAPTQEEALEWAEKQMDATGDKDCKFRVVEEGDDE